MEQQKEYSVFDDLLPAKPSKHIEKSQRLLYFIFLGYFIILAFIRWSAFITSKHLALTGTNAPFSILHPPHLLSAISLTVVILCSCILFYRKSIRASIGLLIFGAVIELLVFHFMKAY